jgi:hypothetical protein
MLASSWCKVRPANQLPLALFRSNKYGVGFWCAARCIRGQHRTGYAAEEGWQAHLPQLSSNITPGRFSGYLQK